MDKKQETALKAWMKFFKEAGVKFTVNQNEYPLDGGWTFKPQLILHDVPVVQYNKQYTIMDLFVYIEPDKTKIDGSLISKFIDYPEFAKEKPKVKLSPRATLILLDVPDGEELSDIDYALWKINRDRNVVVDNWPAFPFNFMTIDRSSWVVHPVITKEGKFALFGSFFDQLWKLNKLAERDDEKTFQLFKKARAVYKEE